MIFVDSSVWIDFYRGADSLETRRLRHLLAERRPELIVGDLILVEVLQGIANKRAAAQIEFDLRSFRLITVSSIEIAVLAADHYRSLRARGITVRKTIDALIATRCIHEGFALLHNDRDFEPFVDHLGLIDAMTY